MNDRIVPDGLDRLVPPGSRRDNAKLAVAVDRMHAMWTFWFLPLMVLQNGLLEGLVLCGVLSEPPADARRRVETYFACVPSLLIFTNLFVVPHTWRDWGRCPFRVLTWYYEGRLRDGDSPRMTNALASRGHRLAVRHMIVRTLAVFWLWQVVATLLVFACDLVAPQPPAFFAACVSLPAACGVFWTLSVARLYRRLMHSLTQGETKCPSGTTTAS